MMIDGEFKYVARRDGKYAGKMYRRGDEVPVGGHKWDDLLIEQAHGIREVAQPFLKAVPVGPVSRGGEYTTHTIRQLRQMCKERGLPVYGKKADLVKRLEGSD